MYKFTEFFCIKKSYDFTFVSEVYYTNIFFNIELSFNSRSKPFLGVIFFLM